jgi:hypothetical protein
MRRPLTDEQRRQLRLFALGLYLVGGGLCIIGTISLATSYAQFLSDITATRGNPTALAPRYAWCLYVGLAPLIVATGMRVYIRFRR